MSPGVESNSELMRCRRCKAVVSTAGKGMLPPCPNCGASDWEGIMVQPVCDFCSDPFDLDGECWTFPCESFEYPWMAIELRPGQVTTQTEGSADDWAACDTCHDLIEDGDRMALARRSVDKDIERHPEAEHERPVLMAMTRAMHDKFFDHRNGEAFRERVKEHGA